MKMTAFAEAGNNQKPIDKRADTAPDTRGYLAARQGVKQSAHVQPSLAHRALHRFLLDMVMLVYEVDHSALVSPTRGRKKIAFARQVAMYLAHTAGGLSLTDVGGLFGRDRTTVAHGCALVEDARDDMVFDRSLCHLESAIACQMEMFRTISQTHVPAIGQYKGPQA